MTWESLRTLGKVLEWGEKETEGKILYIKKKNVSKERSEGILVYDIVK